MAGPLNVAEFRDLIDSLARPGALAELGALLACLGVAWVVVRLLRRRVQLDNSIWFGARGVDGVLFPLLALAMAYAVRVTLVDASRAAVFRLAVPMLISLAVIRLTARVLNASFPDSRVMRLVERSVSWLAWIAVVLWVTGILPMVLDAMDDVHWKVGAARVSLRNVVEGTLTAGLVMMLALWIAAAIEKQLLRGSGDGLSMRKMAANIVRALLLTAGLLVALSAVGIDLTALSVLGGALGVGLGFGLQKVASNYISGFVILAERSVRIGDMVKVDGFEGRVTDIRTRYTVLCALGGRESIVPNELLITHRVENASTAAKGVVVQSTLQLAYGTDVRRLQPLLRDAMAAVPRVLADPAPVAQLSAFAPDGIELTFNFWIRDPENGQGNVRSDVNLAVLGVLEAEGVQLATAQRVVRLVGERHAESGG
jgi:small-conductance mechanosensitive channel